MPSESHQGGIKINTRKQNTEQNKKQKKKMQTNGKYRIRNIITKNNGTYTYTHTKKIKTVQRKQVQKIDLVSKGDKNDIGQLKIKLTET